MKRTVIILAGISLASSLVACDQMNDQKKQLPHEVYPSANAVDPNASPPPGVVARDETPPPGPPVVTAALLKRGQERFDIYCSVCHGFTGEGNGIVIQRGFPKPPSYMEPRLLAAPSQHFYDVITGGYGVMFSYADRVSPQDRWAIVAYIRALQASQHATLADVPPDERGQLR